MKSIDNRYLIELLKKSVPNTSFLNKLKISYRPYICPFINLLQKIPQSSSVFDIGCGSGMFLMLIAELKSPTKLGGIEINAELIDNAKQLLKKYSLEVELFTFDGKKVPANLNHYDYITMIDVLHHIPIDEQELFLEQVYANMRAGAVFIFKDIDAASKPWIYFNKLHDLVFSGEIGKEWACFQFLETAKKLGFKIKEWHKQRTYVYPHYTVVLEK